MRKSIYRMKRTGVQRSFCAVLSFFMCFTLMWGVAPRSAEAAGQNPGREELARLFEEVGREKNIPPEILKAIAWKESAWKQFDSQGNAVLGAGVSIGLMQVSPDFARSEEHLKQIKEDPRANIACGADALNRKWNAAAKIGNGDRTIVENWYFAVWAYNGLTAGNKYQDAVFEIIAKPPYNDKNNTYGHPVNATPYKGVPAGTLPVKGRSYPTPLPYHVSYELTGESWAVEKEGQEESAVPAMSQAQAEKTYQDRQRVDGAVRLALNQWSDASGTVYVSYSPGCPDGVLGVSLSGMNAPLLLTSSEELDDRVLAELERLKPTRVVLLGGKDVLPDAVYEQIRGAVRGNVEIVRGT